MRFEMNFQRGFYLSHKIPPMILAVLPGQSYFKKKKNNPAISEIDGNLELIL